jgi:hypothetical protein
MLEDTALAHKLEPWLAKERYAFIKLDLQIFTYPSAECKWLEKKIAAWPDSLLQSKNRAFLDSLNRLQNFYYRAIIAGKADTACIHKLTWPADKIFDTLAYNHAWMRLYLANTDSTKKANLLFYSACVSRVSNNKTDLYWPCVYAMVNQYLFLWDKPGFINRDDLEKIHSWIDSLKIYAPDSMRNITDSLELEWHYKAVPYYEAKGKKYEGRVAHSLFSIYRYWNAGRLNDSIALKLSNYLIEHNQPGLGLATLQPWALLPAPDHNVLMQYIRLTYAHVEEDRNFDEYYNFIVWANTYLTHEEWCSLFVGPCNISFQLFDSEKTRNLYCEECSEWKNYAKDPGKWKVKK